MAKPENIDQYIKMFPDDVQIVLRKLRTLIKSVNPKFKEGISYRIPTFYLNDHYVIYFAAFKKHIGIYPVTGTIQAKLKKELANYKKSTGTVQLPLEKPLPLGLIKKIVKLRVQETLAKFKKK